MRQMMSFCFSALLKINVSSIMAHSCRVADLEMHKETAVDSIMGAKIFKTTTKPIHLLWSVFLG